VSSALQLEWPEDLTYQGVRHFLWRDGDLAWKLDTLQIQIKETIDKSQAKSICILSSRRLGKSYLAVVIALEYCIRHPGSIVRILAPTLKQVSDIVQDNLAPISLDAPPDFITRSKSEYRWTVGSSTIRLGALERAHVDNNRGGNADLVIYEEGGFVNSEDYRYACESVIGPQLIRTSGREIHISSPSEDEHHHLHDSVAVRCEATGTLFKYTIYDSPSITPEQIQEAALRCGGYESEAWKREYLAQIIRSRTLMVVPEFDETRHVSEFSLPEHYEAVLSIDLGGIKDKHAGSTIIWDFEHARLLVWEDFLLDPNTPTPLVIAESKRIEANIKWAASPERWADIPGQTQIDWINEHNYMVRVPMKDDRDAQINALRILFSQDKIRIHPRCKALIGCLKSARYNDKRTDFERSELYGHADPLMALVYGNRMINKTRNPFPNRVIKRDSQLYAPHRMEVDPLEQIAQQIIPYRGFLR
jgi:hypothetical protein